MFQYPGYMAFQIPSMARANLQAWLNISGRFASSMQALADLNAQTVRKMVEESNAMLRAGDDASPGDVFGWQSVMFAQMPQKAAAYGQHVMSIITSTEQEVIDEVRSQYERNGIKLKEMANTAASDMQQAAESSGGMASSLAETASEAVSESSNVVLDASGQIAKASRVAAKRSV
jgi:phasin family protein